MQDTKKTRKLKAKPKRQGNFKKSHPWRKETYVLKEKKTSE